MGTIPVQKVPDRVMIDYKERLAMRLMQNGCDSATIEKHPEWKQYIENYVTINVINCKVKDAIVGIVKKLALLNVNRSNNQEVTYPIIHTYRGHNLVETTIFYIDESGNCSHDVIPLERPMIVVP